MLTTGEGTPRQTILYSQIRQLHAWRHGRFKYHAKHGVLYGNPMDFAWGPFTDKGPWLFDLETDPSESYDVTLRHPEVAQRLATELEIWRREWYENPRGWIPTETEGE